MAHRNKSRKLNIPMCAAGVLLVFTLLSLHLTSGLYAQYVTSGAAGDAARVATFHVTSEGDYSTTVFAPAMLAPDQEEAVAIVVHNDSETDIRYTIAVENTTGNIVPLTFTLAYPPVDPQVEITARGAVSDTREMDAGDEATYKLTVSWPVETNDLDYMGMVDLITITLTAEQID